MQTSCEVLPGSKPLPSLTTLQAWAWPTPRVRVGAAGISSAGGGGGEVLNGSK